MDEEKGLKDRDIGHPFQREALGLVRNNYELVAEEACEKYSKQCLKALGDSVWTKKIDEEWEYVVYHD